MRAKEILPIANAESLATQLDYAVRSDPVVSARFRNWLVELVARRAVEIVAEQEKDDAATNDRPVYSK